MLLKQGTGADACVPSAFPELEPGSAEAASILLLREAAARRPVPGSVNRGENSSPGCRYNCWHIAASTHRMCRGLCGSRPQGTYKEHRCELVLPPPFYRWGN